MLPQLAYAQVQIPVWLQPSWVQAKLFEMHTRNSDRLELAQASANAKSMEPQGQLKQTAVLAPVEIAVPKLNEKHLSPEELKELRKQLRQQR